MRLTAVDSWAHICVAYWAAAAGGVASVLAAWLAAADAGSKCSE